MVEYLNHNNLYVMSCFITKIICCSTSTEDRYPTAIFLLPQSPLKSKNGCSSTFPLDFPSSLSKRCLHLTRPFSDAFSQIPSIFWGRCFCRSGKGDTPPLCHTIILWPTTCRPHRTEEEASLVVVDCWWDGFPFAPCRPTTTVPLTVTPPPLMEARVRS